MSFLYFTLLRLSSFNFFFKGKFEKDIRNSKIIVIPEIWIIFLIKQYANVCFSLLPFNDRKSELEGASAAGNSKFSRPMKFTLRPSKKRSLWQISFVNIIAFYSPRLRLSSSVFAASAPIWNSSGICY